MAVPRTRRRQKHGGVGLQQHGLAINLSSEGACHRSAEFSLYPLVSTDTCTLQFSLYSLAQISAHCLLCPAAVSPSLRVQWFALFSTCSCISGLLPQHVPSQRVPPCLYFFSLGLSTPFSHIPTLPHMGCLPRCAVATHGFYEN